jgi:hypothetical protein
VCLHSCCKSSRGNWWSASFSFDSGREDWDPKGRPERSEGGKVIGVCDRESEWRERLAGYDVIAFKFNKGVPLCLSELRCFFLASI